MRIAALLGLCLALYACGPGQDSKAAREASEKPSAGETAKTAPKDAWGGIEPAMDGVWNLNWTLAKRTAVEKDLPMLILFTGSDWCHWCKRLEGEILSKEAFRTGVTGKFVLVKMDFPSQPKYGEAIRALQSGLRDSYGVRGYPTIVLALPDGRAFATTGYMKCGETQYLAMLDEKVSAYKELGEKLAALEDKVRTGEEEALREFYGLLEAYTAEYGDSPCIKETLKPSYVLATSGKSALAGEYAKKEDAYWSLAELGRKYGGRRVTPEEAGEAETAYRKAIAEFGLEGAARQKPLFDLSILFLVAGDREHAEELQREGVLAAPDTEEGKMLARDLGMTKEGGKSEK